MSRSVNEVTLLGGIGKDADTRMSPTGTSVSNITVATTHSWKDGNGEWQKKTEWHYVSIWRTENIAKYLLKGRQIYIRGRLRTYSFEDGSGERITRTEVVAQSNGVILLGGSGSDRSYREQDEDEDY